MKKILVIEDEPPVQANILELLEAEGFEVIGAENGLVGVEKARTYRPNLVICDVMMPELNGYNVLATLRKHPETATIPFIFLTAKAEKADLRQGMQLGADDYLTKPFTRSELLGAISTRLSKHAAIAEHYAQEIKQAEEKLNSLIYYDNLTQLPNSAYARQSFERAVASNGHSDHLLPVLSLNIDRFHRITDSLGHAQGDLLLKEIAERLHACAGRGSTIARMQAGQLVILLPMTTRAADTGAVLGAIKDTLSRKFNLNGREIYITSSIGVALYPSDGQDFETLLRNADVALSYVKDRGGNNWEFFSSHMNNGLSEQLEMETNLRHALERNELRVYYQPQIDIENQRLVGSEALLRWQHPEKGLIPPGKFIPLAEETNLIIPMTEWILREACRQNRAWQLSSGLPLRIAVNLSARQLSQTDLADKVLAILDETDHEPQYLELELTESVLMENVEAAITTLTRLKSLGVRIAIDDFGMGYSSLSQLKRLPFDTLKIDQYFVRNITDNPENIAITQTIIHMAHILKLSVIAEGVETKNELDYLKGLECDEVQGYYFSRPLAQCDFEQYLKRSITLSVL
ncbi:MAG TPA: EAL domain-containing protein [Chloroflexia bacterium]|nr:EAL domain-containing protein [Chloroflexia bacterium]